MTSVLGNPEQLMGYATIAIVVVLIFAFLIGFAKGYRGISKGGFYWVIAGAAFLFLYNGTIIKNPMTGAFAAEQASMEGFIWALVLVIGCILATFLLVGACAALFRPASERLINLEDDDEYGIDEIDSPSRRKRKRRKKISLFSRLIGGVTCVLNFCIMAGLIALLALVVFETTPTGDKLAAVYEIEIIAKAMPYANKYILDLVTLGIIMWMAAKGFQVGFVGTTRILIKRLGVLAAFVLGVALPFIAPFNTMSLVEVLVTRCSGMFTSLGALSEMAGRVVTGIIFAIIGIILVMIINSLLRRLTYNIEETTIVRILDSTLAMIIYLALGVALCVAFWAIMYVFDYLGIFHVVRLFQEGSSFAKECFSLAESFLKETLDLYLINFKSQA